MATGDLLAKEVRALLQRSTYLVVNETELQDAIERVLELGGYGFTREAKLGAQGRVDFLVAGELAIEVKRRTKTSVFTASHVLEQMMRYAAARGVTAVLLATTDPRARVLDGRQVGPFVTGRVAVLAT